MCKTIINRLIYKLTHKNYKHTPPDKLNIFFDSFLRFFLSEFKKLELNNFVQIDVM